MLQDPFAIGSSVMNRPSMIVHHDVCNCKGRLMHMMKHGKQALPQA